MKQPLLNNLYNMLSGNCNVLKFKYICVFVFVWIMLVFLQSIYRNHVGVGREGTEEKSGLVTTDKPTAADGQCQDSSHPISIVTAQKPLDNYPGKESLKDIHNSKIESTSSGSTDKKFIKILNLVAETQSTLATWSLPPPGTYSCSGIIKMHILRI
ncbi:MAG TPA: hypothetical protein PKW80_09490 [Bacteroidales bacterium]|nr:hypothetical protein [Bacteroidales bacterium]